MRAVVARACVCMALDNTFTHTHARLLGGKKKKKKKTCHHFSIDFFAELKADPYTVSSCI